MKGEFHRWSVVRLDSLGFRLRKERWREHLTAIIRSWIPYRKDYFPEGGCESPEKCHEAPCLPRLSGAARLAHSKEIQDEDRHRRARALLRDLDLTCGSPFVFAAL